MNNDISLPFKISDVFEGLAETDGVILFTGDLVKIQFQTKDAIFGAIKSKIREIVLPLQSIQDVNLTKGIWRQNLTIRVSDLRILERIPKQKAGEVNLKVRKKDADLASNFVSNVKLAIADLNLRILDESQDSQQGSV